MLSPQEIEKLPDGLAEIWSEFVTEILMDIAQRLKANGEFTATAQWRFIKLRELGLQEEYIQKRLKEMLKVSNEEMKKMFTSAVLESLHDDEEFLKEAYEAGMLNEYRVRGGVVNPIINKGYAYLNKQTRNFTRSYAGQLSRIYEHALDLEYTNVQTGLMSQGEAVKYVIQDLAKKGTAFIQRADGRNEHIETVINRAVRTTVSKTILDAQMANLEELGCDLVETSSHIDSRPSHAEWQGQIFSLSGKRKKYKPFRESTEFGSIEGLGGINCRHSFYPYFEGLSSKSHKHYKLEHTKEAYEERQKEMRAKNMARKYKREMKVLKAGGVSPGFVLKQKAIFWSREAKYLDPLTSKEDKLNILILKGYEKAIEKRDISPLVKLKTYKDFAARVNKELVGLKVQGNIEIKGFKTHFIDRLIGQYEDMNSAPKNKIIDIKRKDLFKKKRKGVSIEDVKDCLSNPIEIKKRTNKNNISLMLLSNKCSITLNPNTGTLIQCNPYDKLRQRGNNK